MGKFEPTIIAFVCNWCTYTAADLAGTSRLTYPPNVRLIRMMCTGMVDPKYVIKALLEGADAVLISGCHPGDCHYINGNLKARRRVKLLKEILPRFGFNERRLKLTWIGASEGVDFAKTIKEMEILPKFGFDERRLKLTWIGASEGVDFAKALREMVADIKTLGPSEVKSQMVL